MDVRLTTKARKCKRLPAPRHNLYKERLSQIGKPRWGQAVQAILPADTLSCASMPAESRRSHDWLPRCPTQMEQLFHDNA